MMEETDSYYPLPPRPLAREKFRDGAVTAKGEARASVPLTRLDVLWLDTGSLCNIECHHCYVASSPSNDRLAYLAAGEVRAFLDEIERDGLGTKEIGFTGGEPFMNRDLPAMLAEALGRGFSVLVLTNAMQPMQRPSVKAALLELRAAHGDRLGLRVSLDHYAAGQHDLERGAGSFARTVEGIDWLSANGIRVELAGRTFWHEDATAMRAGFAQLIAARGWRIDAASPHELVLFPEMDARADVPEITTQCWGILGKRPEQMMCATSRMVVKRKGAANPVVVPCTLLPYESEFEMGATLREAAAADGGMFDKGAVRLCHPHCAKFCVLGGGSCSI
jgi:sulfatase maturation enzyme AslB (radical SAM superfamily)